MSINLNRRAVLATLLKGSAVGLAGLTLGGCETLLEKIRHRPMRRDLATLAANDPIIETYKAAVAAMKALPASDPRNWGNQANIHFNFCPHSNWFFLPWHRAYLMYFEDICRELTGNTSFALPYWNWTCNRSIPSVFFGGASNPLYDSTRMVSPSDALLDSWVGPSVISSILAEPNFLIFASGSSTTQRGPSSYGPLEGNPHNNVHGWVGGDMGAFHSPLDPVFWTHHNMIDRIWWDWNTVSGHSNTNDPAWANFKFVANFVTSTGSPTDVIAGLTALGPLLVYQFDDSPITSCGGALMSRAIADARVLRRFLEEGAPTKLRTVRRLETTEPLELPVGRPSSRVLKSRELVPLAQADLPKDTRVLIRAQPAKQPVSGDYFVRVFVNLPNATAETPTTDPHYVGSFGFFHDDKMPHPGSHNQHENPFFLIDATPAIQRVKAMERIRGGEITVQVIPIPMPGRQPIHNIFSLNALQIDLTESIAAEAKSFR